MGNTKFDWFSNLVGGKRGKWITLVVWIIVLAAVNVILPQASSQKNDAAANLDSSKPSIQAEQLAEKEFPSGSGVPALLTWYHKQGMTNEDLQKIQTLSKTLDDNPLVHQVGVVPYYKMPLPALKQQLSKDGTTFVQPIFFEKDADANQLKESLIDLKNRVDQKLNSNPFDKELQGSDLLVRVTGPVGIQVDATALFGSADVSLLIATVTLVLVFLLLIYRSPILALIPLIAVGFAYGLVNPVLGGMAKAGWISFDSQSLSIMTVLLFGAGTDYCLFLIARFRSNLKEEEKKTVALKKAIGSSSGAIAMSVITVVLSLLALLLAQYGSIHRFAVPFSLSILFIMLTSITLVPALLAILGRISFFPFIPRTYDMEVERAKKKGKPVPEKKGKVGFGTKLGNGVVKKPWMVTIVAIIILGFLAIFSSRIQFTFDTLSSFPEDIPSREGFSLIGEHFNPGELAPAKVMVQTDGEKLDIKNELESKAYISKVSNAQTGSNDTNLVAYDVEFDMNPYSNEAMDKIPDLRSFVSDQLNKAGIENANDKVWISGQTAQQYDVRNTTAGDEKRVMPVIIIMIALLLLAYLRSVVAMVYLVATVLLSFFSALGLGWIVLHYGFHVDAIQGFIPLYAFVFIVALGEDYNIFMISSIWKKSRSMPLKQAIKEGIAHTGAVITSAGLILAGTFAVLTTLPIQVLVQFGTVTAIGVLLDTFVVRPFLVPAITTILDKWIFWPAKQK